MKQFVLASPVLAAYAFIAVLMGGFALCGMLVLGRRRPKRGA